MDLAALDIKIGADLSQLQKDLSSAGVIVDQFSKDLATIGATSAAAAGGMSTIATGAIKITEAFKQAPTAVNALEQSLESIANEFNNKWNPIVEQAGKLPVVLDETSASARKLQQQFAAFGGLSPFKNVGTDLSKFTLAAKTIPDQLTKTAKASSTATLALGNLGRVAQDLPFGFIGIANNLNPLLEGFQRLQVEAKATGTSVSSLLVKSLTGPGGLGLALSVVSAALTFASFGMSAWTRGFETAKESSDDFKDSIASMAASLNTELTSMSALISVARDYSASQETRQNAIDELQKRYPGYLSNLNLENINSQETAISIEKLTAALERKAQVQAYSNLLTTAQENLIKQQNTSLGDQIGFLEKIGTVLKSSGNVSIAVSKGTVTALENQAASTKVLQDAVDSYSKKLTELTAQQAEGNDFKLIDPTKSAKAKKDIESISDVLAKLRLNLSALDTREFNEGLNLSDEKIKEIEGVVKKLIVEFKVNPDDTIISKLFGDINSIKFGALNFKEFIQNLEKSLPKEAVPDIPLEIKPFFDKAGAADAIRRFSLLLDANKFGIDLPVNFAVANSGELDALENKIKSVKATIESLNLSVQNFLNSLVTDALVTFGEAIGAAFAGGNAGDVFANFFKTFGEGLQSLGKTIIATAPLIAVIKNLFKNPLLAIPAGIALIALGKFIESKIPKLAEGGIVPGGFPNDTYPALLSSNEAVIPLDKGLGRFLNTENNVQYIVLETKVSANDLLILGRRAERKDKRTF